jgi:hypothetical protein
MQAQQNFIDRISEDGNISKKEILKVLDEGRHFGINAGFQDQKSLVFQQNENTILVDSVLFDPIKSLKYSFTFDMSGNVLCEATLRFQDGFWENVNQAIHSYDANGNELTMLEQIWEDGEWDNVLMETSTYDSVNHLLSFLYQNWENDDWKNDRLRVFSYNSLGQEKVRLLQVWVNYT